MNWNKLISQFLNGDTNAIQAVFTIFGFLVGVAGTYFVAKSFRQQTKINAQQYDLNRIAGEKHRRTIRPNFQVIGYFQDQLLKGFELKLTNAIALNIKMFRVDERGNRTLDVINQHNAWEPNDPSAIYFLDQIGDVGQAVTVRILQFTDEDENLYLQMIKQKGNEVYATFPQLELK